MKIHIDIDSFFVSATRILNPELEAKPVAIGGRSDTKIFDVSVKNQTISFVNSGAFVPTFYKAHEHKDDDKAAFEDSNGKMRGVITTSSYEARAYGVKTAMSIAEALCLCPTLIVKAPNMTHYQNLSHQLHQFLSLKVPLIEQASIDEFYGDVSGWIEDDEIELFILNLKKEIFDLFHLPVSIGAAPTKYIAKLATTYAKPYGIKVITKENFDSFINPIDVEKFAGIGTVLRSKLHSAKIYTLGELRERKGEVISWGSYAKEIYCRVDGVSDTPLKTQYRRKSIGISRSFLKLYDRVELQRRVAILARHLCFAIVKLDVIPTTFHLSIRYEMQYSSHKNLSLAELFTEKKFLKLLLELFAQADIHRRLHIIKLSISCGSFTRDSKKELSLLGFEEDRKEQKLTLITQNLREKYGIGIIRWGAEL